jgi:glycosyltransferase involved in cell wall biosynthesis
LKGGGAERQAALWATICSDAGHEVTALAFKQWTGEFHTPPAVERRYGQKRGPLDLVRLTRAVRKLAGEVDVVVAFQPYCALISHLARVRTPVIAVTGEDPRRFGDTSRVPKRALRAGLAAAVLRTGPTQGLVDCHRELGIAADREWMCVPNVADAAAFATPERERAGALFVGRLVPEKDPLLAIDAAEAAGVPLRMLGDGELRPELERVVRERGADVEFLGFSNDPWPIYASAQTCLVTSHYEAFGNMLIESLAAGTPVVAGDCDFGPREVLTGAAYSRLVARDRDALAAGLRAVVAETDRAEIGAECRSIAGRYSPDSLAPLIESALQRALELAGR